MFTEPSLIIAKNWKQSKLDPLNQGMDKQTLVHPYNVILLSNITEQTTDT